MLGQTARRMVKRTLSFARVKLLYSRVTLTRFTTLYFFFAIIACVILTALQAVNFADNSAANALLSPMVKSVSMNTVTILDRSKLQVCTSIPNQPGTVCTTIVDFASNLTSRAVSTPLMWIRHGEDDEFEEDSAVGDDSVDTGNINISKPSNGFSSGLGDNCVLALAWMAEIIQDGEREDIVTLLFQIWLFSLAFVAILNESIPHLGAAFFGHALGTVWAGTRLLKTHLKMHLYRDKIVPLACGGVDVMGSWWDLRIQHSIPILVINFLTLVAFSYLSAKLYRVYANESFSRVGASPAIHRIYKIVLLFSVCLQLSGFFSLASTVMWIDKICHGAMKKMARHWAFYLTAFIVVLVFQLPWLYLGWVCVRRECKRAFAIFCGLSAFLLVISTLMFSSPLYRFIFLNWPFFATITVTAYILSVATSVLGVLCRLNFGKGLAHYLQVTEALEGLDFTPVSFSKGYDSDAEKVSFQDLKASPTKVSATPIKLQLPSIAQKKQTHRGSSIYYESNGVPLQFSSSPPLISELGPPPRRSRSAVKSPSSPPVKTPIYSSNMRGSMYYEKEFMVERESRPSPNSASGGLKMVLSSPPARTSSAQSSPTFGRGLPANPRTGRDGSNGKRAPSPF